MQEYDLKIKEYQHFPLPVMITDYEFNIHWSNERTGKLFVSPAQSLARLLEECDLGKIHREVEELGSCTVTDILPLSGMRMSVLPIRGEDKLLLMFMDSEVLPGADSLYRGARTSAALSKGLIKAMEDAFSAMDAVAAKADIMDEGWLKSGLEHASRHHYRMLRICHNIALYSQYQSGYLDITPAAVDLFALLRDWEQTIVQMAWEMGIPLSFSIPDAPDCSDEANKAVCVALDREKFGLVLTNILHNALYFTRPGNKVAVTVQRHKDFVSDFVTVTVADKGIGIPSVILSQVFRPYVSHGRGETVGLGLTLSKLYMDAFGGGIAIDSQPEAGTTVTLTFPVSKFSQRLPLAQGSDGSILASRFSPIYIGLTDAINSPYKE